jgi:hypothetical protein
MKKKTFKPALLIPLVVLVTLAGSFIPSGQVKAADWVEQQKLTADDGSAGGDFGHAVAISGNVVVVSARGDSLYAGAVYVFRYDGATWVQEAKLTADDGAAVDYLGWSVAISGNTIVAGAYGDDDKGNNSGSAYVYRYNGAAWVQEAKFTAADGAADDYFGHSVSIGGDVVVVGAYGDDDKGTLSGSAYVFHYNSAAWVREAKLIAEDGAAWDCFGYSVAISGDAVVVGAYGDDNDDFDLSDSGEGEDAGSAYIFHYNGTAWVQEAKFTSSDSHSFEFFGCSVAINGNAVVVGAYQKTNNYWDPVWYTGSAYVFRYNNDAWVQEAKLTAVDAEVYDEFGFFVDISDNVVVVGTYFGHGPKIGEGKAYVFRYDDTVWVQEAKFTSSNGVDGSIYGVPIAISGNVVVFGAVGDDDKGIDSGAAYVFTFSGSAAFDPSSGPVSTVSVVTGADWEPSETITGVTVGGLTATHTLTVDGIGAISGTITIPELDSGVYNIVITGSVSGTRIFTDAFTVVAATSESQTWCLDSDTHSVGSPILVMKRETGSILPVLLSAPVDISSPGNIVWYSDESAVPLAGVTFPVSDPDNTWNVQLKTTNWKNSCIVEVGTGDSSGGFTPFPDQSISSHSYSNAGGILEVELTLGSQTVPQGSYLAIRVTNNSGSSKTITTAGGVSWFTSPDSDPGYPLPEMAAGLMLGLGLSGLVAYIVIKRKKTRAGLKA